MTDAVTGAVGAAGDAAAVDDLIADEPYRAPVIASERVFAGRVWDVRRDTIEYGGSHVVRDYVDHTGAVGVLAIDDEDRVFVIKQYRHPVRTRDWEIPAGLLDVDGESPLDAAKRELAEEADLEADDWSVLVDIFSSPGGNDEAIRIFLARGVRPTAAPFERTDEEADMETRWVDLDACVDAVLARRVQNAPLVAAALAAHVARSRGWTTLGAADAPWPARPKGDPTA